MAHLLDPKTGALTDVPGVAGADLAKQEMQAIESRQTERPRVGQKPTADTTVVVTSGTDVMMAPSATAAQRGQLRPAEEVLAGEPMPPAPVVPPAGSRPRTPPQGQRPTRAATEQQTGDGNTLPTGQQGAPILGGPDGPQAQPGNQTPPTVPGEGAGVSTTGKPINGPGEGGDKPGTPPEGGQG